jgi:putative FmdB family regulatory protein
MPTYEYKCDACGHAFEKFQSITAGPIRKCPHCGKNKVRRLISSGGGLIFKGGGFYITDYRDASYKDNGDAKPAEAAPAAAAAAPAGGAGGDAGSKPAPAPAAATESKPAKSEKSEKAAKNRKS